MDRGFQITGEVETFLRRERTRLVRSGDWFTNENIFEKQAEQVATDLSRYVKPNGTVDASSIVEDWFPRIDADIFVSHSHSDKPLAELFVGWLDATFGLRAFIDSSVWLGIDSLQSEIDRKYCFNKTTGLFDYERRNKSTAHVHMMLGTALAKMIRETSCFFFIGTPNSLSARGSVNGDPSTMSPWIYFELALSAMLQPPKMTKVAAQLEEMYKSMSFEYAAETRHLQALGVSTLRQWRSTCDADATTQPLPTLFRLADEHAQGLLLEARLARRGGW